MALTLRDLVAMPELKLELHTSGPDVDRAITWVHVSELLDPTPFLTGGELLLTTGLAFGADTAGAADDGPPGYVERLRSAGVVGLGFGTGLSHDEVPAELLAAARRWGLAGGRGAAPDAVHRDQPGRLQRHRRRRVRRCDKDFHRAAGVDQGRAGAVGAGSAGAAARPAGGRLGRADRCRGCTAGESPAGSPAQLEALAPEIAKLRGHRGAVSSAFPDRRRHRQPAAGRLRPRRRAFLAVGRPGALSAADRHLVNAAVLLLTIRLEQSNGDDRGLAGLRSAMVRLLLAGEVDLVRPIAADIGEQLPQEPLAVLVVLAAPDRPTRRRLTSAPMAGRRAGWPGRSTATLVVIAGEADPGLPDLLAELARSPGTSVGVARVTRLLRTGRRAPPGAARPPGSRRRTGGHVTSFGDISAQGVTGLIDPAAGRAFAESLLGGLDRARPHRPG